MAHEPGASSSCPPRSRSRLPSELIHSALVDAVDMSSSQFNRCPPTSFNFGYGLRLRVSTPVPCPLTNLSVAEREVGYKSPLQSTPGTHLNTAEGYALVWVRPPPPGPRSEREPACPGSFWSNGPNSSSTSGFYADASASAVAGWRGDTPQKTMRVALRSLSEPYASEMAAGRGRRRTARSRCPHPCAWGTRFERASSSRSSVVHIKRSLRYPAALSDQPNRS